MAAKSTAQLTTDITNNITANGSNAITGTVLATLLQDMVDSDVNKSTDSNDLATNAYKSNKKAVTNTTDIQITFVTDMGTANYKVVFRDPSGVLVVATSPHDVLSTGFQIDGSGNGDVDWFAFIDNDS